MLILPHADVQKILAGREARVIDIVRTAYRLHEQGKSAVPHSVFLRFPDDSRNRIIALPAFIGGSTPAAGMKWVASFPDNVRAGLDRASATILLNSLSTGQPLALVEGSLISAQRTAASAALAASLLTADAPPTGVTLVGCGVINMEVLRFLTVALPTLSEVTLFDLDVGQAQRFAQRCAEAAPRAEVRVATSMPDALAANRLISIATTASEPYTDLAECVPGSVVLHLSLRDIHPDTIVVNQNVVDDAGHVCRERTSLHLAELISMNRRFIDATVGEIECGTTEFRRDPDRLLIFSPFGLGVLDIAVAEFVRQSAISLSLGLDVGDFLR
jgi:2,3-diaminopropionate biosynthesis protein SbnB